jgi:hypothetical protein
MTDDALTRRRARSGEAWRERLRAEHEERGEERLDLDPRSAYELLTRQMVAGLSEDLREIRQRVNGLLFVTVTAVIADVVIRLTR